MGRVLVFLIGMAKTRNDPFLRKGNVIRYRIDYNTPWKVGTVINRAGKRTSKLKNIFTMYLTVSLVIS